MALVIETGRDDRASASTTVGFDGITGLWESQ